MARSKKHGECARAAPGPPAGRARRPSRSGPPRRPRRPARAPAARRAVDRRRRALVGAERLLVVVFASSGAPGIEMSRSSARISSPSSTTSSRTLSRTSSSCSASSRRCLRTRVVTSSPMPPMTRTRKASGMKAGPPPDSPRLAARDVAHAVGEVEQDRVDVAAVALSASLAASAVAPSAHVRAAGPERPPGHEHERPRPVRPSLEAAQRAVDRAAELPHRARAAGTPRTSGPAPALVDPLPQLLGLRGRQLGSASGWT